MAIMIRSNFQDIFDNLLPAIDAIYMQAKEFDETKAPWRKLFSMKKSSKQFENITGFSGFGQFATVPEGDDIPMMDIVQLHDKKFTHSKFAGAWSVTEEMEDDDQYELVSSLAKAFSRSYRFTKEVNFANTLNNAFTTELAADGLSIANDAHLLANGTSFDNNVATDFGVAAMQTCYNYFATLTDDQGIRIKLTPKMVVANPANRWVIGQVMRSDYNPAAVTTSGANDQNAINVLAEETLQEIYWAEITDTDAWFALASPEDVNGFGLRAYDRQEFTTSTDFDIRNLTMISVGRGRWSRGCVDWRQIYCSAGG